MNDTNVQDPQVTTSDYDAIRDLIENEPAAMVAVREYYERKRIDYAARILAIETFLGFLASEGEIATRLHRLENFVGIKPA